MNSFLLGAGIACAAIVAGVVEQSKNRKLKIAALVLALVMVLLGFWSCTTNGNDANWKKGHSVGYEEGYQAGYDAAYEEIENGD